MPVHIWDRLLGREIEQLTGGRMALGRLFFVAGGRSLSLNGTAVRSGSFLAADGSWTLWDERRHRHDRGDFGHHAMPDDITVHSVMAIGRRLGSLVAASATATEWLSETPLMGRTDMDERIRARRLDKELVRRLPHLRAACHRPVSRLHVVDRLVRASQVRRVTPAAIIRLGARSEDWVTLRPDGVVPERLLNPAHETDLDFYENRVLVRLVDHLWHYVHGRLVEVERIEAMLDDVSTYVDDASGRPWRVSQYLFHLIEGLVEHPDRRTQAERLREDLQKLRDAMVELRGPAILPGVHRRADIGTVLRSTNVFTNDDNYRNAAKLWRAWVANRSGKETAKSSIDRTQEWCESFTFYVGLLLMHALAQLDLVPKGIFQPGETLHCADQNSADISLHWERTATFVLCCEGKAVLRIIPIAHALTASEQPGMVTQEIDALRSATTTDPRTLIVYPGRSDERAKLPLHVRLTTFQGCEAPAPAADAKVLSLLPVSPLEIDSVTRLARSLRWALVCHLWAGYPAQIQCPSDYANAIAGGADWLVANPKALSIVRPPAPHELAAAQRRIEALGFRAAQFMQRGDNSDLIARLRADLSASVERTAELTRCPLCRTIPGDPSRTFEPRDNDAFCSRCDVCEASWELRWCASCEHTYPMVYGKRSGGRNDDSLDLEIDGDAIDQQFGSETLSARCWIRSTVAYCPHCGKCAESRELKKPRCRRCSIGAR